MVKELESANLREVGEKYDLTGERVRQIYKKVKGVPYTGLFTKKLDKKARVKARHERIEANKVKFVCSCGTPVKNKDGKLQKYCRKCRLKTTVGNRDMKHTLICELCKKTYNPLKPRTYGAGTYNHDFCTRKHYWAYRRLHPEEFGKLSLKDIADIMATPKVRGSGVRLAKKYGITSTTISKIRSGK